MNNRTYDEYGYS